jgi:hypothetical protein
MNCSRFGAHLNPVHHEKNQTLFINYSHWIIAEFLSKENLILPSQPVEETQGADNWVMALSANFPETFESGTPEK